METNNENLNFELGAEWIKQNVLHAFLGSYSVRERRGMGDHSHLKSIKICAALTAMVFKQL